MTIGLLAAALLTASPVEVQLQRRPLGLDFEGNRASRLMYMPSRLELSETAPEGLRNPPAPWGRTRFGSLRLGNGRNPIFFVALQEQGDEAKLWFDHNQNGDFADEKPASWTRQTSEAPSANASWQGSTVFQVPYRANGRESRSPYGLNFFWSPGRSQINFFRATILEGEAKLGGRTVRLRLWEDGNDGVFDRRYDRSDEPSALRPVVLTLDDNRVDPRGSFTFEGVNYLADIRPDGSRIRLEPSFRVVSAPPRPAPPGPALLAAGSPAPDFTVEGYEGPGTKLSDHKGQVVVLKFWATWCGPCLASMPHFEQLYNATKDQGVRLLAVCVSDEREAFRRWVPANRERYTFPVYFDPAGRTEGQSISRRLFGVAGIPTVFIIDREGKVAASVAGYTQGDKRVDEELKKLGIRVPSSS